MQNHILSIGEFMDLHKSIVSILNHKRKIVGTGFVAGKNLILTCGHVVEQATGGLNERVTIHFDVDGTECIALVELFSPGYERDVALLRVDSTPANAHPLTLGVASASPGNRFYTYGYASVAEVQGIGARGQIVDVVANGQFAQLTSQEPDHGMSGAPVLDEARQVVIGMITKGKGVLSEDKNLRNTQTTFATTTEAIWALCPQLPAPRPISNPFGDRGRIEDPARYFLRQPITREVFDELRKHQSISIVGDAQSGKSSLLWYIKQVGPLLLERSPADFAYFNLELVRSEDEFFEFLCETLGIPNCRGYRLGQALRGRHIYLCLDEMEKMAWKGFSQDIRSELRGLADGSGAPLTLVISSRQPLSTLFPDAPGMTSPLAGLCNQLSFRPFMLSEAIGLARFRLEGSGYTLPEDEIERVWRESRGQVMALQKALHDLFETQR